MKLDTYIKGAMLDSILHQILRKKHSSNPRIARNLIELSCSLSEITIEEAKLLAMSKELTDLLKLQNFIDIRSWITQNFHI